MDLVLGWLTLEHGRLREGSAPCEDNDESRTASCFSGITCAILRPDTSSVVEVSAEMTAPFSRVFGLPHQNLADLLPLCQT